MHEHPLKQRWLVLCENCGAEPVIAEVVWEKLRKRYSEAWRFYHTLAHIASLLEEFDEVRGFFADPVAAEFAIWFHDVVYDCFDPRVTDNEEQSAAKADGYIFKLYGHLSWHMSFSKKIVAHIIASKHRADPLDSDARLFVDLDLAILGKPADVYRVYAEQIAEEYTPRPYTRAQYREGRTALVLRPFLARDRIYYTQHFYERYEMQARANLLREIETLRHG